ncbi:MFS transporter [Paenibacillus allorhizosphaerae]|uniref:Transporter n=1 Tax=Paenibacillus allorhizosphaerae TaxID=2849866 RepID=A0ABM8VT17_9BACL|nr:MFS transporter [Paenibacillus allorhizosphaerae]CAG7656976.1 putative transporter [Paenibacillus allorhizosphaerae]
MSTSPEERPNYTESASPFTRKAALLYAIVCGSAVAAIYFSQPLLDMIAIDFGISNAIVGTIVTATQLCYALGLFLLVPLGDLIDPRRLVTGMMVLSAVALSIVALASNTMVLFIGMGMVGFLAVVAQILVALAAARSSQRYRGQTIGLVTSGIVIGILLARTFSGTLADLAGWRSVYIVSAAITVCMVCSFLIVTPASRRPSHQLPYTELLRSVKDLFMQIPLLRIRALLAFFIFSDFSILWSSMVLPMSSPPLSLSHSAIGLFGFAGVAGAVAASRSGKLADRGLGERTTGAALLLLTVSWLPIGFLQHSLWIFVVGVIMLDFAVQAVHVTNQSMILSVRPEARSRLTAGYMIFYSMGSATGAVASTWIYSWAGWSGVCILGASISVIAILFWGVTLRNLSKS